MKNVPQWIAFRDIVLDKNAIKIGKGQIINVIYLDAKGMKIALNKLKGNGVSSKTQMNTEFVMIILIALNQKINTIILCVMELNVWI